MACLFFDVLKCQREQKNITTWHWEDTVSKTSSVWETITSPTFTLNTIAADGLTWLYCNNHVPVADWLTHVIILIANQMDDL